MTASRYTPDAEPDTETFYRPEKRVPPTGPVELTPRQAIRLCDLCGDVLAVPDLIFCAACHIANIGPVPEVSR